MSWAVPLFRVSGIQVRLHIFFIMITVGMFLREVLRKDAPVWWVDVALFTILLPFLVIVLHEFGHSFAARAVGGDSKEILIWPLGGLAFVEVPHTPRALFLSTAAGPGVNVLICVACAAALITGGFFPNLNPLSNPYTSEVKSVRDGRVYTSEYGLKLYKPGTAELVPPLSKLEAMVKEQEGLQERTVYTPAQANQIAAAFGGERAVAPTWVVWVNRTFWLSWVLLLFNLVPAYPLDGGQMMQSLVWARTDYRRGVVVASYSGFGVAVIFLIVSIAFNEALFMGLALFMLYSSTMRLHALETEDGPFGYDFSAGYTSLEKDDEPPPRPKRAGAFTRWWQARKARKIQRELEQRAQDEERMDQLLAKIAETGKNSLTDEEKRFLERVSARYRNRS